MPKTHFAGEDSVAFYHDQLIPLKDAHVSLAAHGLNYGTGCFEGLRGYWNRDREELYVVRALEHFQRLLRSAKVLRIEIPYTAEELVERMVAMLRANQYQSDVYIRPLAFKEDPVVKVSLSGIHDAFGMFAFPMGDYVASTGISVAVSSWRRLSDNMIPSRAKVTGAYINAALASDQAHSDGYDEAIMLGEDGQVSEASSSNLFMVRQGTLVTTPVTSDILEGITRQCIFEIADREGIPVEVRPIDRTELYVAEELFLCGTGVQLAGVTSVDRRPVGSGETGPITGVVQQRYFDAVRGNLESYQHWLTPTYRAL